jgi:segregation and condensation protein B
LTDDNVLPFPLQGGDDDLGGDGLFAMLEALLFAAGEPVTVTELCTAVGEVDPHDVRAALHNMAQRSVGRGVRLVRAAGGWQLRTDPRFSDAVMRLRGGRPQKMSSAALETLSVVAYRQPATRGEVDEVRGVNSGGVLRTLLEKGYLRVVGRRDEPGRPLEYGTTALFLEMFSLDSLASLPTLKEREELAASDPMLVVPSAPEGLDGDVLMQDDALPEEE